METWRPATLTKRDSNTGAFHWILRNFMNSFFIQHCFYPFELFRILLHSYTIFLVEKIFMTKGCCSLVTKFSIFRFSVSITVCSLSRLINTFNDWHGHLTQTFDLSKIKFHIQWFQWCFFSLEKWLHLLFLLFLRQVRWISILELQDF